MEQVRTRNALSRIEAALNRIEALAGPAIHRDPAADAQHDRLRQEAGAALAAIDQLIADLER